MRLKSLDMEQDKRSIDQTPEWKALQAHWQTMSQLHMRNIFEKDIDRCERFSLSACGLHLDYSKNLIDEKGMDLLMDLARAADLTEWGDRLLGGDKVKPAFIPVRLPRVAGNGYALELMLVNGAVLRIGADTDPVWVSRLVKELERTC